MVEIKREAIELLRRLENELPETYAHSQRVSRLTGILAKEKGLSSDIEIPALLHDIGKLKIKRKIITKKGALTPEEYLEIQKHPLFGAELLRESMPEVAFITALHHVYGFYKLYPPPETVEEIFEKELKRWNKLKTEGLVLTAGLISIADTLDANKTRKDGNGFDINLTQRIEEYFGKELIQLFEKEYA